MKTITLWQPWASLLAYGAKKYETRGWETTYRGPIAIHAANLNPFKAIKPIREDIVGKMRTALKEAGILTPRTDFRVLPLGSIIAVAELIECYPITYSFRCGKINFTDEEYFGDFTIGRFAWDFANMTMLQEPIPARGAQRLWNWDETPHLVAIDPWVIDSTKIWTPQGIRSGKRVEPGREDAVIGLEVA